MTGRWASSGGGALQLPRQLRAAVRADPGWMLVVADVAQLEPRVLAAMSADRAMADAARGQDLYAGVVDSGAVATRAEAKIAMLGAMYGATTGDSGRLVPRLRRTYPRAMGLVDEAARIGEDGGLVSDLARTHLPAAVGGMDASRSRGPPRRRHPVRRSRAPVAAHATGAGSPATSSCRARLRSGRCAWLAETRTRLAELPPVGADGAAERSGPVFARRPHLAFFLHDEVIVHTPAIYAEEAAQAVREAAAVGSATALRRLPDRLPARPAHRGVGTQGVTRSSHPAAPARLGTRMGRLDGRVAGFARTEERPGSTGQDGG